MNSTICYSAINPRPFKDRKKITPIVKEFDFLDSFKIIDAQNEVVQTKRLKKCVKEINLHKLSQSFARSSGIKALAKRVAFSDLNTIRDESGNILDATQLPHNLIEAQDVLNAGKTAQANFSALPKEITKNMSPEDFVKNYKQEDLINFINGLYAKTEKKDIKEEVIKDE